MSQLVFHLVLGRDSMGDLFAKGFAELQAQPMKGLLHRVHIHPEFVTDFRLRRMTRFVGQQTFQLIEQRTSSGAAIIFLEEREDTIEDGRCPLPFVNLTGGQSLDRFEGKSLLLDNLIE